MTTELCKTCDIDLATAAMKFYLPSIAISKVYAQLVQAGLPDQATLFLKINQTSYESYCTRCWIYNYIKQIVNDPETSDEDKTASINIHLCSTAASTNADILWQQLGRPELN